jgi:S-adenosylmethionine:tRNA ribosyltransferase-isomerase
VELLLLRPLEQRPGWERWEAIGHGNKPLRAGTVVDAPPLKLEILSRSAEEGLLEIAISTDVSVAVESVLERDGHVPIPPYLGRDDEPLDRERYQTVYARRTGSVAAPTAGLHFSEGLIERLRARGVRIATLELEVGLGTFRPVTADDLDQHRMHEEHFVVSDELAREVAEARERSAPVVAIGTTVVRALESARDPERRGQVRPLDARTRLLIQPGYEFGVVDALFTNFHQPRSTLLALVSAFAGISNIRAAYAEAVASSYRFLSYGDAMWIPRRAS